MQIIYIHTWYWPINLRHAEFQSTFHSIKYLIYDNSKPRTEQTIFKMMSEVEPLELEFLSSKEERATENVHKNCTTKTILLVAIVVLALLCFIFGLLYILEKTSNGKKNEIQSLSNGMTTTKPSYCFTQICIHSSFRKWYFASSKVHLTDIHACV